MTDFMKSRNMEEDMAEEFGNGWTALGCIDPIYIYIYIYIYVCVCVCVCVRARVCVCICVCVCVFCV